MHLHCVSFQILPVNIKSLAGSVATLANWLTAWAITMTASLMLNWSSGGLFLSFFHSLPPFKNVFPIATLDLTVCLGLTRNICYLRRRVYHGPHFRVLVGAGDQGKNARGNRLLIPLTRRHDLGMGSHTTPCVLESAAVRSVHESRRDLAAILLLGCTTIFSVHTNVHCTI